MARVATRVRAQELPTGCLVFSDRAVPTTARGLEFSMRIDAVVDKFEGLPLMGFTRRRPVDQPDLYPVPLGVWGYAEAHGALGWSFC